MELRIPSLILALLATLSPPTLAQAGGGPVTAARIRAAASQFLQQYAAQQKQHHHQVTFTVGHVDPRVRMAACGQPIQVSFKTQPDARTHVTLQAACEGNRPWRMFLGATVRIKARAYVAKMPLTRGTRITRSMLKTRQVTLNRAHGSIFDSTQGLVGMQLIRAIGAGTVMTSNLLRTPNLINRGDRVIIRAKVASIAVKTQGTALSDGHKGEQIRVRNDRSKRTIRAVVIGHGKVSVTL